jgi:predicted ATPase/DNA-binding CsgD family transcriptional regulator
VSAARPQAPDGALPRQLSVFVGRAREVAEIRARLRDPACRLLTLTGPGGIGKTRLALEAAAALTDDFADGVRFVPLQGVTTTSGMATALASAVRCPLSGQHDPFIQLLNFLAGKQLLLILDNLEQLHDEAVALTRLLEAAPGVKLLVTSREVLALGPEWRYPVDRLPVPEGSPQAGVETAGLLRFDAVRLFVECARRVQPDFALERDGAAVAAICRLVDGMPLAIELAAAWLNALSCADVAAEIRSNLDFLATSRRDVPARHRSIRAVCDHSWQRLSPDTRTTFARLAVFQGGFRRQAAACVAGATLSVLATLVEKSLLQWDAHARTYRMHTLLHQYAWEQLRQMPSALDDARAQHGAYYVAFLLEQTGRMLKGEQQPAAAAIAAEFENVRAAWAFAVQAADAAALAAMAPAMADFSQVRGRYLEGAQLLEQAAVRLAALEHTPAIHEALALVLTYLGSLYVRLGRIAKAQAHLEDARAHYRELGRPPLPGYNTDPEFSLGIVALIRGDYATAAVLGERVCQTNERHAHAQNRALGHYLLASTALAQGDLQTARAHAGQAYVLARATGSQWFMAYCLNELGNVALAVGDYAAARSHFTESHAIREEFEDPEGMALALVRLGEIALVQGNHADARVLYQKAHALYRQIDDRGGLATALAGLGHAAVGLSAWDAARDHFQESLSLALSIKYLPCLFWVFSGAAMLLLRAGDTEQAITLLATAATHPNAPRTLADTIERRFDADLAYLAPNYLAARRASTSSPDLAVLAQQLAAALELPHSRPALAVAAPVAPFVEPLSARELELLHLVAAGLKNREIADRLVISVNTVKVHTNNIYGKLGVGGRVQAVARARELGLL